MIILLLKNSKKLDSQRLKAQQGYSLEFKVLKSARHAPLSHRKLHAIAELVSGGMWGGFIALALMAASLGGNIEWLALVPVGTAVIFAAGLVLAVDAFYINLQDRSYSRRLEKIQQKRRITHLESQLRAQGLQSDLLKKVMTAISNVPELIGENQADSLPASKMSILRIGLACWIGGIVPFLIMWGGMKFLNFPQSVATMIACLVAICFLVMAGWYMNQSPKWRMKNVYKSLLIAAVTTASAYSVVALLS